MMETKLSPLLFFLLLTGTPRENSATPIASPAFFPRTAVGGTMAGEPANIPSVIVNNMAEGLFFPRMEEGIKILTEAFIFLQSTMLASKFEESVSELETEIFKLPFEIPANRYDFLKKLYMAQTRINLQRTMLTLAATQLKGYCEELISIYNNYGLTKDLLTWTSKRFLEYSNRVKRDLDEARKVTKEIQDLLSQTKAFLFELNAKLKQNKEFETQPITIRIICLGFCDISLVINGSGKRVDIRPAQTASDALHSHVDVVNQYLKRELDLIINWRGRLAASISDIENISLANIQFSIKGIKDRLGVLVNACEEYINHKLPAILLKGMPSITPGK